MVWRCLEFKEQRSAVLIGALGLTVGALSFLITLSLVGFLVGYQDARKQSEHRILARAPAASSSSDWPRSS
jgi:hypothetical protein